MVDNANLDSSAPTVLSIAKGPSATQFEIASLLHGLADGVLEQDVKSISRYITLEAQVGKSKRHKNAVSILPRRVRFTLPDSSTSLTLNEVSTFDPPLRVERIQDRKKVVFVGLTVNDIKHSEFFRKLVLEACRESRDRQEGNG